MNKKVEIQPLAAHTVLNKGLASYDAIIQLAMPFKAIAMGHCDRCGDQAQVDAFNLCEQCNGKVAEEYAVLYTDSVMEH